MVGPFLDPEEACSAHLGHCALAFMLAIRGRHGGSLLHGCLGLDRHPVSPSGCGPRVVKVAHSGGSVIPLGGLHWLHSLVVVIISGEGHGCPLQDCCLENPMDKGPDRLQSMGVPESRTRLSD